ncbi:MAG: threonine--tRNA ligase, partial [Planctomycetes bacterium]|nr:threonine--tRNA ligase [Planctomycetota bacterium]
KRDHRKLGKELDLFLTPDEIGGGLVILPPKGGRIRSIVEDFWRQEHFANGYELLYTPHIGLSKLWEISGHLGHYKENMYSPIVIDEQEFYLKPMNCPFHLMAYKSKTRSYRELPLRWAEQGTVYRYEKSGVLHGLMRVRGFTQDDAHIFCTPQQLKEEIKGCIRIVFELYKVFGIEFDHIELSTRPAKSIGTDEMWRHGEQSLQTALEEMQIDYKLNPGDGAFYGPKVDFHIGDAIGRTWQLSTIQVDFAMPESFDMTYIDAESQRQRPVMVHRAITGSLERFLGILVEHFAGDFPLWLAPEQVRVLTITDAQKDYAREVLTKLKTAGLRASYDFGPEKVGAKIRRAELMKIPYIAVIGNREVETGEVSLRRRLLGDLGTVTIEKMITRLTGEVAECTLPAEVAWE